MKNHPVALFVFIDALGWEVIQQHPWFLQELAPQRKGLRTILGYSSACDPSIISGRLPAEHGLWSSYYYAPQTSPFGPLSYLKYLPSWLTERARVRGKLSSWLTKWYGFTGYFQLYNIPFEQLQYFDYAEKKRIYQPNGLPIGKNIFDAMSERSIPYHVCEAVFNDQLKIDALAADLVERDIHLGYITLGRLDGLMHMEGTQTPKVGELLAWYERQIAHLFGIAAEQYKDVSLYVFADHGMHDVSASYDLQNQITKLGLSYGKDYVAMYDSTMARFWFMNEAAKQKIQNCLQSIVEGRILSDQELQSLGVFFPDGRYGETIFLMNSGVLIVPSYMGRKRIPGMHGYHPDDTASTAAILSNRVLPEDVTWIHHIYHLMEQELGLKETEKRNKVLPAQPSSYSV